MQPDDAYVIRSTPSPRAAANNEASSPKLVEQSYWCRSTYPRPPWSAARWKIVSIPRTDAVAISGSRRSPSISSIAPASACAWMLLRTPLEKSSTTRTVPAPRAPSLATIVEPMNEAPPVTSAVREDQYSLKRCLLSRTMGRPRPAVAVGRSGETQYPDSPTEGQD